MFIGLKNGNIHFETARNYIILCTRSNFIFRKTKTKNPTQTALFVIIEEIALLIATRHFPYICIAAY